MSLILKRFSIKVQFHPLHKKKINPFQFHILSMGFLQLIIFFFNYCRARRFSPLCHGILGTFQRWNLKVTSPVKSIFEFFPSVGKFLQLMFLGDNICMRASGLILPVMAMTVALNTNVSWFIWDCHCRYFFPGPGNRELHMAETFSTEPGKVRFLCEGRNSPFMRKWLRFFFFCVSARVALLWQHCIWFSHFRNFQGFSDCT